MLDPWPAVQSTLAGLAICLAASALLLVALTCLVRFQLNAKVRRYATLPEAERARIRRVLGTDTIHDALAIAVVSAYDKRVAQSRRLCARLEADTPKVAPLARRPSRL